MVGRKVCVLVQCDLERASLERQEIDVVGWCLENAGPGVKVLERVVTTVWLLAVVT